MKIIFGLEWKSESEKSQVSRIFKTGVTPMSKCNHHLRHHFWLASLTVRTAYCVAPLTSNSLQSGRSVLTT